MAYGTAETTLETFDTVIPDDVFREVTRIIFLIATNYILGFDPELRCATTHFVEADAAAKSGTLQALVDRHFG